MKRFALATVEYLLGFIALGVFAAIAFGAGKPTDEGMVRAFKVGAIFAAIELAVMAYRSPVANRLVVGANAWLVAGGVAAFLEQWWWLRGYQRLQETSLFLALFVVGAISTALAPTGFVAAEGPRRRVIWASIGLLAAVLAAVAVSAHLQGNVTFSAVVPLIALSLCNRVLGKYVARGATR